MVLPTHRGKNKLKLLRRLEGSATLTGRRGKVIVACSAGEFEERDRCTVTGSLDGALADFEDGEEVRLCMADTTELMIRLISPDEFGSDFKSL